MCRQFAALSDILLELLWLFFHQYIFLIFFFLLDLFYVLVAFCHRRMLGENYYFVPVLSPMLCHFVLLDKLSLI